MGFASTYLNQRALFPEIVKEAPDKQTGIIVVVPACDEPGICNLLNSLALCSEPDCKVEIIIVVNTQEDALLTTLENRNITIKNIKSWKREHSSCFFRLLPLLLNKIFLDGVLDLPVKQEWMKLCDASTSLTIRME